MHSPPIPLSLTLSSQIEASQSPARPRTRRTTDSFIPGSGDIDMHLVAVASYMDRTEDTENDFTTDAGLPTRARLHQVR